MTGFAQRRARSNRKATNPLVRPISGWVPAWSIIEHVGRRSGKTYSIGIRRYQNHPNSHGFATV